MYCMFRWTWLGYVKQRMIIDLAELEQPCLMFNLGWDRKIRRCFCKLMVSCLFFCVLQYKKEKCIIPYFSIVA